MKIKLLALALLMGSVCTMGIMTGCAAPEQKPAEEATTEEAAPAEGDAKEGETAAPAEGEAKEGDAAGGEAKEGDAAGGEAKEGGEEHH